MSTSDQNEHGPLTRKQLREIRLTGSTPVITPEDAAAAAAAPPAPPVPPVPPVPSAAEPIDPGPAPTTDDAADSHGPLTRRQVREQERARTGSVAVTGTDGADAEADASAAGEAEAEADEPAALVAELVEEPQVEEQAEESEPVEQPEPVASSDEPASAIVSGVPDFARPTPTDTAGDDDDLDDEIVIEPVSASGSAPVDDAPVVVADESAEQTEQDDVAAVLGLPGESESSAAETDDVLADVDDSDDTDVVDDSRPTVNSAFGEGVLTDAPEVHTPFRPSFDELLTVGDSTGSQHSAPNALIFTPSPGDGSLSGPVASTGEILVTGSYELPQGMGSQGHAHGTTDGKDIDAVLIDGELPPASSPTPIAASAAVSTIKPAGEVIRPPAPEKGSRLTLVLTIIVGGLALALAVALVVAISTNVF